MIEPDPGDPITDSEAEPKPTLSWLVLNIILSFCGLLQAVMNRNIRPMATASFQMSAGRAYTGQTDVECNRRITIILSFC